jgi:N-acetylglucosamine-6-phosphate deacetylase
MKGPGGIVLVTDAMAALGMPPGNYHLGDYDVIVDATSARLANGTLAGSILTQDAAVRNLMGYTGCSLAEALAAASFNPANLIGLESKGRLEPGADADLVLQPGRPSTTWVAEKSQKVRNPAFLKFTNKPILEHLKARLDRRDCPDPG